MVETETLRRRIAKPLGLHIIAVFDFIAVGLVPLVSALWVVRSQDIELPFVAILISVGLPIMTMAAVVWAWIGDNAGRCLLLAFVTLTSALLIFNHLIVISSGDAPGTNGIRSVGWIVRAVFWIGINWWYFNRPHVVAYFKQATPNGRRT